MTRTVEEHQAAHRLVGQYMQLWALVERGVARVIAAACELDSVFDYVITTNTSVKDKIAIARTALTMISRSDEWRERADYVLRQVTSASVDRNMIAHTMFDAVEGGDGAVFLRVLARGDLQFSELHWDAAKFQEISDHLVKLRSHLLEIETDIQSVPVALRASSIIDTPPPRPIPIPPAVLSAVPPPPQDDPDNDQPKRKSKRERKQDNQATELRLLRAQIAALQAEREKAKS